MTSSIANWKTFVRFSLAWTALGVPASLISSETEWRIWQAGQGLADSYVSGLTHDRQGGVWLVHGDVPAMTQFDGSEFRLTRGPAFYNRFETLDGVHGWIADHQGLHFLRSGVRQDFPEVDFKVPSHLGQLRVADLGDGRAVLVLPSGLAVFSAATRRLEPLRINAPVNIGKPLFLERALDGSIWVICEKGAGNLKFGRSPPAWKEYPFGSLPAVDPSRAVPCVEDELFVTAVDRATRRSMVVRLVNGRWETVARQEHGGQSLFGWRDGAGDLWLASSDLLMRKPVSSADGAWQPIDQYNEVLSAKVNQILANPDGSFFLGTVRGLALHVKPAWRPLGQVTDAHRKTLDLRQHMAAILEDRRGQVWLRGQRSLFRFDRGRWDEFPFPQGYVVDFNHASSLGELPDGRILIALEDPNRLAAFDPANSRFAVIRAPDGYNAWMFARRRDGSFAVVLVGAGINPDALATFDGETFANITPIGLKWNLNYPRDMIETPKGEIWVAGTGGLIRVVNGRGRRIEVPAPVATAGGNAIAKAPSVSCYSLLAEPDGQLLVGGKAALYRWNGSRLELLNNHIESARSMIRDRRGHVWAASGGGVFRRVDRAARRAVWVQNGAWDGLPSSTSQAVLEDSTGRLWAATNKGPAWYVPGTDPDSPDAVIAGDENLKEAAPSGQFRVVFSGRDRWELTPSDLLLFSWRLDGGQWSTFTSTTISIFDSLRSGPHTYELVAMDRQGNISAMPARLEFSVVAPWYRSGGFLCLLAVVVLVIAGLIWLVIHQIRQISRARREAEAANRAKSDFLANMSHEIRTPMNGVIGMAELALQSPAPEEQREYLQVVRSSGLALLTIINDILDFSKIEAGKLQLESIPFRLRDSLDDTVRAVATEAHDKGLDLVCDVAEEVPDHLAGDPGRLRQILLNLVGNAIKFTSRGEVVVSAGLGFEADGEVCLHFKVRDTGVGIPPEKQRQVFQAFSQADASTTRRYGGTGLGLTICRQLAALMQGKIWIESEVGQGTTVHFTACLRRDEGVPDAAEPVATAILDWKILVIDDSPSSLEAIKHRLKYYGFQPTLAESGRAAVERMTETAFDLAILSLGTPPADGLDVAAALRRRNPRIAIIALGAARKPRFAGPPPGCDTFRTKPVKASELLEAIQSMFTAAPTSSPVFAPGLAEQRPGSSLRVLLAEDNPVNRRLAQIILQKEGHQVVLAVSGREALDAAQREEFDLILMDVQMPEMDGLEATAAIRQWERSTARARTPIVALTARAMKGDREQCLEAGMDGYVEKPIQIKDLLEAIATHCPAGSRV